MVPTSTRKPGKMGVHFLVREKPRNFEHTGKVWEFYPKYWKGGGNFIQFLFKLSQIFNQSVLVKQIFDLSSSLNKTLKNGKSTGKVSEVCQSKKVGTMNTEGLVDNFSCAVRCDNKFSAH